MRRMFGAVFCLALLLGGLSILGVSSDNPVGEPIKIGAIGVYSGSAASWGLGMKYATQIWANELNEQGGMLIDGVRHPIEVIFSDTQYDVEVGRAAAEELIYREGVKYILGPNTSVVCRVLNPIAEAEGVVYFGYGGTMSLYEEYDRAFFSMSAPWDTAPAIYKYLKEEKGAETIVLVAKNITAGIEYRDRNIQAAETIGLEILNKNITWEPGIVDFSSVMLKILSYDPDIIDLDTSTSEEMGLATKVARQMGYDGYICAESGLDGEVIWDIAGELAQGVIYQGTIPPSSTLDAFRVKYEAINPTNTWNPLGPLFYITALMLEKTLQQAGASALDNTNAFMEAVPDVELETPLFPGVTIKYVGLSEMGRLYQIGRPIVLDTVQDGESVPIIIIDISDVKD